MEIEEREHSTQKSDFFINSILKRNLKKCNNKENKYLLTQKAGKEPQKLRENSLAGVIQSVTDVDMADWRNIASGTVSFVRQKERT